jgi:hypothetical protein
MCLTMDMQLLGVKPCARSRQSPWENLPKRRNTKMLLLFLSVLFDWVGISILTAIFLGRLMGRTRQ